METCSWINIDEEIAVQDMDLNTSKSQQNVSEENNNVEIIEVCERMSKEFCMAAESVIPQMINSPKITVKDPLIEQVPEEAFWASLLSAFELVNNYKQLEELVLELYPHLPPLAPRVSAYFSPNDKQDLVAQAEIPVDGPRMLTAVMTVGDGNCLSRSASKGYFNMDTKHIEIRACTVIEGIVNMDKYLSHEYLERGATHIPKNADLPTVFSTFSEFYQPGQKLTEDSILCIYCMEIHSCTWMGTYMGIWQLAQLSSVLGVPIHTIYPVRGEC